MSHTNIIRGSYLLGAQATIKSATTFARNGISKHPLDLNYSKEFFS